MSWSCPHIQEETDRCRRLDADCVPGRPGCVLPKGCVFAVPVEERLGERRLEKRGADGLAADGPVEQSRERDRTD